MSAPELVFELVRAAPQCSRKQNGRWEELPLRTQELINDPLPATFDNMRGRTYKEIAERATKLNEIQLQKSYIDYVFSVEVVTPEPMQS